MLKCGRAQFLRAIHFLSKFMQKGPKNRVFCIFKKVLSFVFLKTMQNENSFMLDFPMQALYRAIFLSGVIVPTVLDQSRLQDSLKCNISKKN